MTRPSDTHWELVGPHSYALAQRGLAAASASGAEYVVAGGWAVFAYAPRVPSVDLDLFVPDASSTRLKEALGSAGLRVAAGGEVEFLDLDGELEFWGFGDPDLGIAEPACRPRDLFDGRIAHTTLALDPPVPDVPVPAPEALAVTKLVALRNRDLGYRAHFSGHARMLLGPSLAPMVLHKAASYYLRKAGKDLLDLGFLLANHRARTEAGRLVDRLDLRHVLQSTRQELHEDVIRWAQDAALRAGASAPLPILLKV